MKSFTPASMSAEEQVQVYLDNLEELKKGGLQEHIAVFYEEIGPALIRARDRSTKIKNDPSDQLNATAQMAANLIGTMAVDYSEPDYALDTAYRMLQVTSRTIGGFIADAMQARLREKMN